MALAGSALMLAFSPLHILWGFRMCDLRADLVSVPADYEKQMLHDLPHL